MYTTDFTTNNCICLKARQKGLALLFSYLFFIFQVKGEKSIFTLVRKCKIRPCHKLKILETVGQLQDTMIKSNSSMDKMKNMREMRYRASDVNRFEDMSFSYGYFNAKNDHKISETSKNVVTGTIDDINQVRSEDDVGKASKETSADSEKRKNAITDAVEESEEIDSNKTEKEGNNDGQISSNTLVVNSESIVNSTETGSKNNDDKANGSSTLSDIHDVHYKDYGKTNENSNDTNTINEMESTITKSEQENDPKEDTTSTEITGIQPNNKKKIAITLGLTAVLVALIGLLVRPVQRSRIHWLFGAPYLNFHTKSARRSNFSS